MYSDVNVKTQDITRTKRSKKGLQKPQTKIDTIKIAQAEKQKIQTLLIK